MFLEMTVLIIGLGMIAAIVIYTVLTGTPPTPSSSKVCRYMIEILPPRLPSVANGRIYELGAGWGGVSQVLADRFSPISVVGIELSPIPFSIASLRKLISPRPNLEFKRANFFKVDLSDATLVVCYLSRDALVKLRPKLERELAPEALIVSNTFAVPGWRALDVVRAPDLYRSPVYLYERSEAVARSSQS